jgi:hypothetical protein
MKREKIKQKFRVIHQVKSKAEIQKGGLIKPVNLHALKIGDGNELNN